MEIIYSLDFDGKFTETYINKDEALDHYYYLTKNGHKVNFYEKIMKNFHEVRKTENNLHSERKKKIWFETFDIFNFQQKHRTLESAKAYAMRKENVIFFYCYKDNIDYIVRKTRIDV